MALCGRSLARHHKIPREIAGEIKRATTAVFRDASDQPGRARVRGYGVRLVSRVALEIVIGWHRHARFAHSSCAETLQWRASGVQHAASRFGHVLRFHSSITVRQAPVSANDGDDGSRRSARAIPTTATTRHEHNARGMPATPTTGASIAAHTRSTASATARCNAPATLGGARVRLQRWTRQRQFFPCLPALTGSPRRRPPGLQRWTRGRWKSLCFPHNPVDPGRIAKRGRDRP
jgi:hypothetical protein